MSKPNPSAPRHFTRWVTTKVCSICTQALAAAGCGDLCQGCHDGCQPTEAETAIMQARGSAAVRPPA